MDLSTLITVLISSSVISAIVSSIASRKNAERNIYVEYITKDRKEWRDSIREIAEKLCECNNDKDVKKIYYKLSVRLNPKSVKDKEILSNVKLLRKMFINTEKDNSNIDTKEEEILKKLSILLKLEWEKSKSEAKGREVEVDKSPCFEYTESDIK